MRNIPVYDRYAQTPSPDSIGQLWHSTRKATCGCYLIGTIVSVRPGAVRINWLQCLLHFPDSWEATERGTLAKM